MATKKKAAKKAVAKKATVVVSEPTPAMSQDQLKQLEKISDLSTDVRRLLSEVENDVELNVRQLGYIVGKAFEKANSLEDMIIALNNEVKPDEDDDDDDDDIYWGDDEDNDN